MNNKPLRIFSKITCYATLFLIFAGAMVKSAESGLSVPDWPLSYGTLFPPMVGGVFYEHGHRMIATAVGFFMLCLAIWLAFKEERTWVKVLGYCALGAVIAQGVLGGLTLLFFLPTPISVSHGVLAQAFFVLTIIIAYSLSVEREHRRVLGYKKNPGFIKLVSFFMGLIFIQLIMGAVMRHTASGLAIPDFPKMGGEWWPMFNRDMLFVINDWRFENNLEPVTIRQVTYHFIHRLMALFILVNVIFINTNGLNAYKQNKKVRNLIYWIDTFVILQIALGIATVLTIKHPHVTSSHVVTGAAILGLSVLLILRISPLTMKELKEDLFI